MVIQELRNLGEAHDEKIMFSSCVRCSLASQTRSVSDELSQNYQTSI